MDIGNYRRSLLATVFVQLIVGTVCVYPYNQCGYCDCCAGACDVANNYTCDAAGCIDGYWGNYQCLHRCQADDPCLACGQPRGAWCTKCNAGFYVPTSNRNDMNQKCIYKCNSRCRTCTASPSNCQICDDGYVNINNSKDCRSECPNNCDTCSSQNVCSGCKPGFYNVANNCQNVCLQKFLRCNEANTCTECKSGWHGNMQYSDCRLSCPSTCQLTCSHGCTSNTCDKDTGECPSCWLGFKGDKCDSCVTGKYGYHCNSSCSVNCKGPTCDRNSAFCTEGCVSENYAGNSCESCKVGRHGTSCNRMCPMNCNVSICSKDTGICTNGCNSNFTGETCIHCITGVFSDTCTQPCPANCYNDTCDKMSGICLSCKPHYTGEKCEECVNGYYGQTCSQTCSTGCISNVCNRTNGVCLNGCTKTYSGDKCCIEHETGRCALCSSTNECFLCFNGYYGKRCSGICSTRCMDSQCEIDNGYCTECQPDMFGKYCEYNCSDNCYPSINANRMCNQQSGECIHGCKTGNFGFQCDSSCSQNCADNVCDKTNGWCTNKCVKWFHGPTCTEETLSVPATTLYGILGVLCLTVLVIIVLIIYIWRLRRNQDQARQKQQANVVQYSNFPKDSTREFGNATGTVDHSASSYETLDMTSSDNTTVYNTINSDN